MSGQSLGCLPCFFLFVHRKGVCDMDIAVWVWCAARRREDAGQLVEKGANVRATRLIAVLVGLAVIAGVAAEASACYHPGIGRFLQRDPGVGGGSPVPVGTAGPIAGEGFASRDQAVINQYADGMGLYQYVAGSPECRMDPQGTNIYLKTGNTGAGSINNAVHQKVCVDTWDRNGCKTGEACFSFGKTGWMFRFGARLRWLGWNSHTLGGLLMKGEIYEDLTVGAVVKTQKTTVIQDRVWLNWMRRSRVGTEDVYSVGRHNCRTYSQWEFRDAP